MKTCIKTSQMVLVLLLACGSIPAGQLRAQTFRTLHSFTPRDQNTWINSDGVLIDAGLVLSDNTLYGTASNGGTADGGTVFSLNINGTGFTTLYSFSDFSIPGYINSDGARPYSLILSGNILYGITDLGGSAGNGTVFSINTDGTGFTSLYNFSGGDDGAVPNDLTLSSNTLYGTTGSGGSAAGGTVFAINTDGTGFTILHSFTMISAPRYQGTNSDGANPGAGLVLSGNTLYGTASSGGTGGSGTVFRLNTDGTGFTTLYSFTALSAPSPYGTNRDGAIPDGDLVLSGNTLYGTANSGGTEGHGTVFNLSTDGTGFTSLHSFTPTSTSDGAFPDAGLVLSGNALYGTTSEGGAFGNGIVFKLNTDGTGFRSLHNFTPTTTTGFPSNSDGANPLAGLLLSGNTLYGTTFSGGIGGSGTIFSISLPGPQLTIASSGTNVLLSWPTNATGFTLQSTTNLGSSAVWTDVSIPSVVINGQNTVTNRISGTQQLFRLGLAQ